MSISRKRSGGPRTSEGKATCSLNSLKTGVYSTQAVLPWENQQDFLELRDQFYADFPPEDVIETQLLDQLVVRVWKRLRIQNIETTVLTSMMMRPIEQSEAPHELLKRVHPEIEQTAEAFSPEDAEHFEHVLASCDELYATPLSEVDFATLEEEHGCLVSHLLESVEERGLQHNLRGWAHQYPEDWVGTLMQLRGLARELLFAYSQHQLTLTTLAHYKEKRLVRFLESGVFDRAHAENDRGVGRAMAEWRRHREWRLKHVLTRLEPANEDLMVPESAEEEGVS